MSVYNTLLTQTKAGIDALSLTWGNSQTAVPVIVSEEPLNREGIEPQPLPNILVSPPADRGEVVSQAATGNLMEVVYPVEITIVASGNASFEQHLPTYLDWREQIRRAFQRAFFPSLPQMWFVALKPKQVLNTDLQRDNYDLSILGIDYSVTEQAKN